MSITYLKHPVHGTKIATMEPEVEADVENGWEVYNPNEQHEKISNSLAENIYDIEANKPEEIKRRRKN